MSNNSVLDNISDNIYEILNNQGLQRLNPIFSIEPITDAKEGHFLLYFLGDSIAGYNQPQFMWFVFGGTIFRMEMPGDVDSPAKIELLTRKDCHIYIDCIIECVRRYSKKSLILIQDDLPQGLIIDIETNFRLPNERESVLNRLAGMVFKDFKSEKIIRATKQNIQNIIKNGEIEFKSAVNEIMNLKGFDFQSNLSYCLVCGDAIDKLNKHGKPNLFCRKVRSHRKGEQPNPDNCRNVFRHRQKSRLGLKSNGERNKHDSQLYKELQQLIQFSPLNAFEELKLNHPDLYLDGRKRRSEIET